MERKITITIDINWGSDFQQDFMEKMLQLFLKVWREHGLSAHKQNKITYVIDTHDGYKIRQV